jgi:hypothetical protein
MGFVGCMRADEEDEDPHFFCTLPDKRKKMTTTSHRMHLPGKSPRRSSASSRQTKGRR